MENERIVALLKEIVAKLMPESGYVSKYGGELIEVQSGAPKTQIGGIFAYSEHVSLEFGQGAFLDNEKGHLEGKGKNRRHLKFHSIADVSTKDAEGYLKSAMNHAGL